jgi:hypothetical protein
MYFTLEEIQEIISLFHLNYYKILIILKILNLRWSEF